jgi:hypothetical protein
MSLAACAAAYSLTDVLVSQTAAPIATASATPASVSVSATLTPAGSIPSSSSIIPASYATPSVATNGTVTTTGAPLQVTNAAGHMTLGKLPALALAAGALLAL